MSSQNRIYHLCRVVSPPDLLNKPICVPSGWIQRRSQNDTLVLVRYPNELTTQALKRAFNDENYSEDWMTIKAVELSRANYNECMEILKKSQQDLDRVNRKRSHAQLEQGSSEAIETPRSRGMVICGTARSIQLSLVRDKSMDQQSTEKSHVQFNAQDIASNEVPAENPNRNELEYQRTRKKQLSESSKTAGPNLVVTCRPAKNIQLLSAYDDSIEQSEDKSKRLVVTVLPSINIKSMDKQVSYEKFKDKSYAQGVTSHRGSTEEAYRDVTENQSNGRSKSMSASDTEDTAGLANAIADRELQQLMIKYHHYKNILQERLSQERLKNEFNKRNAFEDTLETENDEVDNEEDEVVEEEQHTKEKEIEKKHITMKPDIIPNVKAPKREKITLKKINPVSLPAEYDKNDSSWTLKYREPGKGLVEIPSNTGVYVEFKEMYDSLNEACKERDIKCLARLLLTHVFSDAALRICTLSGKRRVSGLLRPGLNERAVKVIVEFAIKHGKKQKWPEFEYRTVLQCLRSKLNSLQRHLLYTIIPQKSQEI